MVKATLVVDQKARMIDATGTIRTSDLIVATLFGADGNILGVYNPEATYNKHDKIPYITEDGELIIIVALHDGVTGPFNKMDWEEWSVVSELDGLYDDYIVLSYSKPSLRRNKVWLEITEESMKEAVEHNFTTNDAGLLIYKNLVVSARKPTMTKDLIWGVITEKAN